MGNFASAKVIYDGTSGTYEGGLKTIDINCDRMRAYSPRPSWLKRRLMPGDGTQIQYILTFDSADPEIDSNTLQGFMIEVDGQDTMIDLATADSLINACNCPDCDSPNGNPVTPFYGSGVPAFVPPTGLFYCVTRADDGSPYAVDKFVTDYNAAYVSPARIKSNTSGISIYTFQSFYTLAQLQASMIGSDTVAQC